MTTRDAAANPLDIMEQIVTANDWAFDRRGEAEMVAEAPGRWCDYGLYFNWSREISTMHFPLRLRPEGAGEATRGALRIVGSGNERLWIGHFGIEREDRHAVYRHAVLLAGCSRGISPKASEDMNRHRDHGMRTILSGFPVRAVGRLSQPPRHWTRRCWTAWGRRDRDPVPAARRCGRMGSAMLALAGTRSGRVGTPSIRLPTRFGTLVPI